MRLKHILIFSTLLLLSCFDDKGDYDYTNIDDVKISNIKESYNLKSAVDILNIEPILDNQDDYSYLWTIYPEPKIGQVFDKPVLHDTISYEQNLSYRVAKKAGDYRLILSVKSKITDITEIISIQLNITAPFSNGMYVLKTKGTDADIDFFDTDKGSTPNMLQLLFGRNLKGEARDLSLMPNYTFRKNEEIKTNSTPVLFASSDDNLLLIDIANMDIIMEENTIFFGSSQSSHKKSRYVVFGNRCYMMVTDNSAHHMSASTGNHGKFGNSIPSLDDVSLSKYRYSHASGVGGIMMFDETNRRFIYVNSPGGNLAVSYFSETNALGEKQEYNPNKLDYDMVYMGILRATSDKAFALMEHKDTKQRLIFELGSKSMFLNMENPIINVIEVPSSLALSKTNIIAHNADAPYFYYTADNKVYMYNITNKQEIELYSLPSGEEVSFIKVFYLKGFAPAPGIPAPELLNDLVISTYKDDKYKIYNYKIKSDASIDIESETVVEGEGKVQSIHYSSSIMNNRFTYRNYPAF